MRCSRSRCRRERTTFSLSLNGETFLLNLPGDYTWAEFSESADEGPEVLADQFSNA